MIRTLGLTIVGVLAASALEIEERRGAPWPNANHFRFTHQTSAPVRQPVLSVATLPDGFNPDSLRVTEAGTGRAVPAKTDWRRPLARVSWLSTGATAYHVYFDLGNGGETQRPAEPAMIGTGDRLTYGRTGVRGKLSVGLWAYPAPLDFDGDGDTDLIIACTDHPYNGTYLFRNIGSNQAPLYDRAEWLGPGLKDLVAADFNGDGNVDLVTSGGYYDNVRAHRLTRWVKVTLKRDYHVGRDDLWMPADYDGDGKIDLLNGISDWREYGWDDAYDSTGTWRRGPLHGYVFWHRNVGTNATPSYEPARRLPVDLYGSPAPNFVDWDNDGRPDLLGGSFVDTVTWFRNIGTRSEVKLGPGQVLPFRMDLCMIQPRAYEWRGKGQWSLIVGEEDGRVALVEGDRIRHFEQVDPYVKSGALSRPVAVDWSGDGLLDIIAGNSAGYIQYFENVGTRQTPAFADRGNLSAGGKVIRRIAGVNGSIQGPAEAKWGYSNPSVADWDMDGKLDLVVNDIWGDVVWYRNTSSGLSEAAPLEVEWSGRAPKPDWVWWEPKGKQLLTQWRTTPRVVDWDRDGLPDLVMLNHQGYLSLFRRAKRDGKLMLGEPERIFVEPNGRFLNLAAGRAGRSGRRKIELVDWNGDGTLDLITDSNEGPIWYRNIGSQQKPVMELRGPILKAPLAGHNPTPNAADWNGDGKLDLLIGAEDGFFYYFDGNFRPEP